MLTRQASTRNNQRTPRGWILVSLVSHHYARLLCWLLLTLWPALVFAAAQQRQTIKALYIPLADHYAAIVAYERYREDMQYADFQIEQMGNWDLLRAYFQSGL